MSSGSIKEIRVLVRKAKRLGCTEEKRTNGHVRIIAPNGNWFEMSFSPARASGVSMTRRMVGKFLEANCG